MFESEEVDDDYFTPVAKTSLASIFKKKVPEERSENETLKYTPPVPKPQQTPVDAQPKFQNIFSCVIDAYLWLNNVYTHKGKLGCAIVKHNTEGESGSLHSILLYDSKKAPVSSALATNTLQVTLKGQDVISYYDRYGKYWYLRGTESDVKKIIVTLRTCNVNIKTISEEDTTSLQNQSEKDVSQESVKTDTNLKILESDTDSSINRKTKASILNRMASMGQSVLPPRTVSIEPSSDSDTNEEQIIAVRHKPVKNTIKKSGLEKVAFEHKSDLHKAIVSKAQMKEYSLEGMGNDVQLLNPISMSASIATTSGQDLTNFFTEQRINNSELRINMTRITDKVDNILDKVNNLEKDKNEGSSINTVIFQKLLHEYESKIKSYEELLQKLDKNTDNIPKQNSNSSVEETEEVNKLKNKITELNNCIKERDQEISILKNETTTLTESDYRKSRQIEEYEVKMLDQEKIINKNNEKLLSLTTENVGVTKIDADQFKQKIKIVMNEAFRAIEINFDSNETYSGEAIRNIIGSVIKRVTIESLKDLD